jgi:hypothetical protein
MNCDGIIEDLLNDCDNVVNAGTRRTSWVINYRELLSYVTAFTNKMIVESLNVSGIIYKIVGYDSTVLPTYSKIDGFQSSFDHVVNLKNFNLSSEAKLILEGVKNGLFILITENVQQGVDGRNAFEIWGLDAGLKPTVISRDPNSQDTQGAFDLTFATAKNKEPRQARNLWLGSYTATLDYLENLASMSDFNNDFNNDFN